jgi:nucleotide-binding universal stress UspA family protein
MVSATPARDPGGMPPTVICAVEQPSRAKPLVRFAGALSRWLERKLLLVSLIAPGPGVPHRLGAGGATLRRSLFGQRWQQLKTVAHEAGRGDADCLIDVATPARGLRVLAEEFNAELIVLGSNGLGAFRSALAGGSVTRRLAAETSRPLVVLPRELAHDEDAVEPFLERPPALVCGIDGSAEAIGALHAAADMARHFDSQLLLLSIVEPAGRVTVRGVPRSYPEVDANAEKERRSLLEVLTETLRHIDSDIRVQPKVLTGDPPATLVQEASSHTPSMIAVGSRGRGAIAEAFLGSVSRSLVRSASVPVLISPLRRKVPHHPAASIAKLVGGSRRG